MLERLKLLENNVKELSSLKEKVSPTDIRSDKTKEWALRYGLLESVQLVIDISCHLVSKYNLGNPQNYSECIELLKINDYLDNSIAAKLSAMVGLRNILVHEYIIVDLDKLYGLLDNIADFRTFAEAVQKHV
jgi:uncharacterized protein YutE (UPF0331/DUF86 family)